VDQGRPETGPRPALTEVEIRGERLLDGGIVENDALSGAQDIVSTDSGSTEAVTGWSRSCTTTVSPPVVASASIRVSAAQKNQQGPPLGAGLSMAVR